MMVGIKSSAMPKPNMRQIPVRPGRKMPSRYRMKSRRLKRNQRKVRKISVVVIADMPFRRLALM